jgi:hypothetical protein
MASCASCLAGCCVTSPHTAAYHLPASPPLIAPIHLTPNRLSMHRLVIVMPLVAPPLQLVLLAHCCLSTGPLHLPPICLSFALAGCCVTSHSTNPLIVSTRCCLSTRRLVVALPLVAPPSHLILLMGHCLSAFRLAVALLLIALPLPLILSACPCLSMCRLHLPLSVCVLFAPAGCQVPSHLAICLCFLPSQYAAASQCAGKLEKDMVLLPLHQE